MVRSWRGWVVAALLAGPQLCFAASAGRLTQQQVDALAARDFKSFVAQGNLHHSFRQPGGGRGYVVSTAFEYPRADPEFHSLADQELHGAYCHASAVVLATDTTSAAYLSSDRSTILTATGFLVDDVLKPAEGITVDREIMVVRPGGRVRDQGEWLSIGVGNRRNRAGYRPGREYLLFLTADRAWNPPVFLSGSWITAVVSGGTVHASDSLALGVPQGQSYPVVRGRLDSLAAAVPCVVP